MPSLPRTWNLLVCLDIVKIRHVKTLGCSHYTTLHILSLAGPPLWLAWSNPLNLSLEPVAVSIGKLHLEPLKLGLFALLLRCLALFWVFFWFFWLLSHLSLDLHVSRQVAWTLKPEPIDVPKVQSCIYFATSAFEASFPFVSACNLRQPWAEQVLARSLPIMCYALAWDISLITL